MTLQYRMYSPPLNRSTKNCVAKYPMNTRSKFLLRLLASDLRGYDTTIIATHHPIKETPLEALK